ncbi:MAG: hypothetical protein NTY11_02225, partial [Candidatus Parcubacteria bacterium]|nr:hypothetical protein [Candidatus Parcubacteria bacterium]
MEGNSKDKKEYISLSKAAEGSPYSQEYLSLRARQGKLKAVKLGRNWATKQEWVDEYFAGMQDYRQELNQKIEHNIIKQIQGPVAVSLKAAEESQAIKKQSFETGKKDSQKIVKPGFAFVPVKPKQPVLRLGVTVFLALFVLISSLVFEQNGIQGVISDIKTTFIEIGQKSKLALDSITNDLKNGGIAGVGLVLDSSLPLVDNSSGIGNIGEGEYYKDTLWQETAHIFSSYFNWLGDKLGGVFVAKPKTVSWGEDVNRISIIEAKIDSINQFIDQGNFSSDSIASLRQDVDYLKQHGVITKEVIQEVQQITQVLPKQIIESQTTIDFATTQELKDLKNQLALIQDWESGISTKIQSYPTGQVSHSSAPVYIASQGLQVGGNATFASLGISGSGSATNFSVGDNMQIGTEEGDNFLVYATSNFESPVTAKDSLYVGPNTELTIDSSGNITTTGDITTSGDITTTGITAQDLVLTGTLTAATTSFSTLSVSGTTTFNGVSYIWPSSDGTSTYALTTNGAG